MLGDRKKLRNWNNNRLHGIFQASGIMFYPYTSKKDPASFEI
jgi:hypothetical protein